MCSRPRLTEIGFAAATREDQAATVAQILKVLAKFPAAQHEAFFRLVLRALPVTATSIWTDAGDAADAERLQNLDILLDFLLDVVMLPEPQTTSSSQQQSTGNSQPVGKSTVFGLMTPRLERLQRCDASTRPRDDLYALQLNALKLVKELGVPSRHKLLHYIAGSASYHHAVKSFCEEQLSRVLKYEETELEDADAMRGIISVVLGSQVAQSTGAFTGRDALLLSNRARATDASILQALTVLSASKAAANVMPAMLQLLCQLMFAADPARPQNMTNKIKLGGVRLCQCVFLHCERAFLEGFLGPVMFPTFMRLLMDPHFDSEASSAEFVREFRQGVYESVALLSTRAPATVAGSEQAFQTLLVKCLTEEGNRTGAGAMALKAFTALATAYCSESVSPAVRRSVTQELIALMNGSKLFDTTQNYARVRAAIATWCDNLLEPSPAGADLEEQKLAIRFALLRFEADADELTRQAAGKALYKTPLPPVTALSSYLQTHFHHKDLKQSMGGDNRAVEMCLRFCMTVTRATYSTNDTDAAKRRIIVEYFAQTLLVQPDSTHMSSTLCETAAATLIDMHSLDGDLVGSVMQSHALDLVKVASASIERGFLMNIAVLIGAAATASARAGNESTTAVQVATALDGASGSAQNLLCGAQYILGSALASLSDDGYSLLSDADKTTLFRAFRDMVDQLVKVIDEGSDFIHYPRSEEEQNAKIALIRSSLDGVRCAGALTQYLHTETDDGHRDGWCQLKITALRQLLRVIEWNTSSVKADEHLASKLSALKRIAVQSFGRSVAGLPGNAMMKKSSRMSEELGATLEKALRGLLAASKDVTDPEFQIDVGEALVALGWHDSRERFDVEDAALEDRSFNANRAAAILSLVTAEHMESKQARERRNATIWLLCICAAGLRPTTGAVGTASSSWRSVLSSSSFSDLVFKVHEFFITMLNDSSETAKESAVKGLAYLRLHAPTEWMGTQFSESLFRRLRCFRAFAAPSSTSALDDTNDADNDNDAAPATQSAPSASTSSGAGSTVENAAYREVSNVAADVGDPELMYGLLYLSATDPLWDSLEIPKDASSPTVFSFAVTDREFRSLIIANASSTKAKFGDDEPMSVNSRALKLFPWLYLLKFHGNSKVASLMASLWKFFAEGSAPSSAGTSAATSQKTVSALSGSAKDDNAVTSEKSVLKQNWQPILQFVLSRLENSRNFKYREAACAALMDLLNGADADDVRDEFVRLWRVASRAVDDVMEAVALAGVKLYRSLGELSLRIAASDEGCRAQLLEFLVRDGITAKNTICRALSIDMLLRLVKALNAKAIEDSLASLIPTLLEYLSSLEMPELQYAQFHVEKKDELERLRVSLSQAGPVGQLLELATTRLKELAGSPKCVEIVEQLTRVGGGIANLLQFGVGLNTRVGTANFVATLAVELPFELRKCGGADALLRRVLLPFVRSKTSDENERYGQGVEFGDALADGLAVRAYCRAAAYLCPLADAATVRLYVRDGIFARSKVVRSSASPTSPSFESAESPVEDMDVDGDEASSIKDDDDYQQKMDVTVDPADDATSSGHKSVKDSEAYYASRFLMISALATKELVAKVPPTTSSTSVTIPNDDWYCAYVFPAVFVGQFAAADPLSSTWREVLDELPPSILYARESVDAALLAIARLLAQPAWDSRAQAVRALTALFAPTSTYRSKLSQEQTLRIRGDLLGAVPGRLWKGKGAVLEALVVVAACSKQDGDETELSALLLAECERAWRVRELEYLESAVSSVGALSSRLPTAQRIANALELRRLLDEWLQVRAADGQDIDDDKAPLPPLLIKCVFDALRVAWPTSPSSTQFARVSAETMEWLVSNISRPILNIWSVRRAAFECLTAVISASPPSGFVINTEGSSSSNGSDRIARLAHTCCGDFGVGDAKYAAVRVAAAVALASLLKRSSYQSSISHTNEDHESEEEEKRQAASVALRLVVEREKAAEALATLRRSEEPSEQQAAATLMAALGGMQ